MSGSDTVFGPPIRDEKRSDFRGLGPPKSPYSIRVWGGSGDPGAKVRRKPNWWVRVPPPRPPAAARTWLRGRRRNIGPLLMLHHAAVLLLTIGPCRRHRLYTDAWRLSQAPFFPPYWFPAEEVFLSWLRHHKIVKRVDRDTYIAGPAAEEFAAIPARLRAHLVGKLILAREGNIDGWVVNYFPGRTRKAYLAHT